MIKPPRPEPRLSRRAFALGGGALASLASSSLAKTVGALPVDFINPIIGASTEKPYGVGKTFPGANVPFGMIQLSPDTVTGGDNGSGYSFGHTSIEGFSFMHLSGVGWFGEFGNLQTMPSNGPMKLAAGRRDHPGEGWRSAFDHASEVTRAGYYAVTLSDYNIRVEATAAPRAGMLRFTFPESTASRIQIDLSHRTAGASTLQSVELVADNAIEGWMACTPSGGGWGNGGHTDYTVFFRVEFSRPLDVFGAWSIAMPAVFPEKTRLIGDRTQTQTFHRLALAGTIQPGQRAASGEHIGFYAEFPTRAGDQILMKAGLSFVGIEGARANLAHDIPDWDFDGLSLAAKALWAEAIGKIRIEGATPSQQTIFETALFHTMVDPRIASDVDGKFVAGDKSIQRTDNYTRRTVFSGWDVFRAVFPLMTLIDPGLVIDEINSLVDLAQETGRGYLERWEIVNAYSGCMTGDPATAVIVDAWRKGLRGFDAEKAYAACRQTAAGVGAQTNRPDNGFYLEHGFVPDKLSWTLDNAYYDWCVAQFAQALGKTDDARLFFSRGANYVKVYDPGVESMRARQADGGWLDWKGRTAGGQGCIESNPGQETWFVPHDVQGLINLIGEARFCDMLEELFDNTPANFAANSFYNHSNEPVHHIPYLFVYGGKPWLTQKWVRRILDNAYSDTVAGIPGNDDVGQMSAWYVLSAVGIYQVCPGDDTFIIGSPLFERATLSLTTPQGEARTFVIDAKNAGSAACYIQSARLNGAEHDRAWLTYAEIMAGGTLELVMGSTPNKAWASDKRRRPPSMSASSGRSGHVSQSMPVGRKPSQYPIYKRKS